MMETRNGKPVINAKTRAEWRDWLQQYSQTEKSVWLIIQRKGSKTPGIGLVDATEEALCFGWIDSLANKRDAESFYLTFTPRNPKSNWSKVNRERVERLVAGGLMTEHGQKMIDIAKNSGKWEAAEK